MIALRKIVVIIFILSSIGCKKDMPMPSKKQPSTIEGLELTFIETDIQQKRFKTICFVTENIGYIAGYNGALYKTNDGGNSWTALQANTTLTLHDIYFLNKNEGFVAVGEDNCYSTNCIPEGPIILHTTNAGQTWKQASIGSSEKIELRAICFASDSLGFAVANASILSTKDRGITWQETKINDPGGIMMDVEFINDKKGLITCTFGKLIKTVDGGRNWNISNPFPAMGANTLALVNENLIFSAGYTKIQKSLDFGNSWSDLPNYPEDIFKLIFTSENIGYAFGRGQYSGGDFGRTYGAIYFTTNGGLNWKGNNMIFEMGLIESASFPTANIGFAISGNVIVKITRK